MSWTGAFRNQFGFAYYPEIRTQVTVDIPLTIVAYLCAVLYLATAISSFGVRGKEKWSIALRSLYAVGVGSAILVCIMGHDWLNGSTEIGTIYLYRSDDQFDGVVGLRVSLYDCNVTLKGVYGKDLTAKDVYYAETMAWTGYGREHDTLGYHIGLGHPHPILDVMDFLSVDAGGQRWGRHFHSAGRFCGALLWTAFGFWVITNLLLISVVCYGSIMFTLTGLTIILSCVVYHVCQPPIPLVIHFGSNQLTTRYGWCYWLSFTVGTVTFIIGGLLLLLDSVNHDKLSQFFNLETGVADEFQELSKVDLSSIEIGNRTTASINHPTLKRCAPNNDNANLKVCPNTHIQRNSIFLEPERRRSECCLSNALVYSASSLGSLRNVSAPITSDFYKTACSSHSQHFQFQQKHLRPANRPFSVSRIIDKCLRSRAEKLPVPTLNMSCTNNKTCDDLRKVNEHQQKMLANQVSDNETADSYLNSNHQHSTCPTVLDVGHHSNDDHWKIDTPRHSWHGINCAKCPIKPHITSIPVFSMHKPNFINQS